MRTCLRSRAGARLRPKARLKTRSRSRDVEVKGRLLTLLVLVLFRFFVVESVSVLAKCSLMINWGSLRGAVNHPLVSAFSD